MEEEDADQAGASRTQAARPAHITPTQLAAALSAAAASSTPNSFMGVTGMGPGQQRSTPSASAGPSTASTPGSMRITQDMFAAAMQQAMQATQPQAPAAVSNPAATTQPAAPDYSSQLATMRDMGIVDEGLALRALQVMGGDLQAAVDLIFQGWLGEDEEMQ